MSNALTAEASLLPEKPLWRGRAGWEGFLDAASRHKSLTTAGVLAFTTLVAIFDVLTGDKIPVMILYLPAILITCWVQHLSAGVALSLFCASVWLVDDFLLIEYTKNLPHKYWLSLVHFIFFVVVAVMTWRLRLAQERERRLASTDALTGLLNRKAFVEAAEREIAAAQRFGGPLAIAYLDCDNFKQVNDTLGHATGDALLLKIAETATASVRRVDSMARLGGDEFACLLPGAAEDEAHRVIARLKEQLDEQMRKRQWPVSFSIGLVVFSSPPGDVDQMIGAADQLMYQVKHGRKDSLRIATVN